jgi:hypothetical protein
MKKTGGVDKNGDFVITVTYNTKSTWELNELERVLADSETKDKVEDYGENFVTVRYPLDLRMSKEEEHDTDSSEEEEEEEDTSPADDEDANDTDSDKHESMSEDTL